jgi:hypothetical protein
MFIVVFTGARHWPHTEPALTLKPSFLRIVFNFISHLRLRHRSGHIHLRSTCTVNLFPNLITLMFSTDRLCGLVVRVPGYRSRGPEFDSRRYQIFCEVVGLERSPLSLVTIIEKLLERKVAAPI